MRVLALDYGTARIGCAVSDPSGTLVRPLAVIEPADARAVARLAAELGAELVVVGLPVSLDGTEGAQAQPTRASARGLGEELDLPVETYDERLTTRMAQASRARGRGRGRGLARGGPPARGIPGRPNEPGRGGDDGS